MKRKILALFCLLYVAAALSAEPPASGPAGAAVANPPPPPHGSQATPSAPLPGATTAPATPPPAAPGNAAATTLGSATAVPGKVQNDLSPVAGPSGPPYKHGAIVGHVVDSATGKSIAGATVAVVGPDKKVIAWSKTDASGDYAIAADPVMILHLGESHHRGLLTRLARGVGSVVTAPVKLAGTVTKAAVGTAAQTVKAGASAITSGAVASAITGTPAPIVAQAASTAIRAASGNARQSAAATAQARAEKIVSGERQSSPSNTRKNPVPGEARISVSASNYKDAQGIAGAFWMSASDGAESSPAAWLETIRLAPFAGAQKSEIDIQAVLLSDGRIETDMVPSGASVAIEVKLKAPKALESRIRIFARESKRHTVTELKPAEGGTYRGRMTIDDKEPAGSTTVSIVALHAEPVEVKLPTRKDDPLAAFVSQLDAADAGHPYVFDPRVMASENRIDLPLTILDPKKGKP